MADTSPYPILKIEKEWVSESEALGSKKKFWYREKEKQTGTPWLFKYPQPRTGQHWAEKVAAEIAAAIHVLHARVELAVFEEARGSATESFVLDGQMLYHGNQSLAGHVPDYDPSKEFKQSNHTLENIYLALDRSFTSDEGRRLMKERISSYFVLDALIGNTDRHHENWGIVVERKNDGWHGYLAPTFDHASSLGRELLDGGGGKSRDSLLKGNRIGEYSERARGAILWNSSDKHAVSPLDLVRRAAPAYSELFRSALRAVRALDRQTLELMISRVPETWMSTVERTFALELMCYNKEQLETITV